MARAEAEAQRLARAAKKAGAKEYFDKHLADGYAKLLSGSGKGRAKRPELVVLVSHAVATRGWTDVREGEVCTHEVGPEAPEVAREIGRDACLSGVLCDGKDLRNFKRWGRGRAKEVEVALELGPPPDFPGVKCVGPDALFNLGPRCPPCHKAKTERDRKAGKLKPGGPLDKRSEPP